KVGLNQFLRTSLTSTASNQCSILNTQYSILNTQ
ncbi:MAG: hypothetical protein ACI910_003189, partial [Oleispira sp.]